MKLKNLSEQTIVITGASSGIGLTTARMAAEKGASLVLAARSENALGKLADEINGSGGKAIYVVADVGKQEDVRKIAQAADENFGGFDTWINNAGVGIFGKIEDTEIEDMRHLFETNFWGLVYGSLEAVKTLKNRGGALINVGSVVSDRAVHLQGIYSTSKHAVKGFTDALRMELEADDQPVSVTLIQPSAINTPFSINAKNYTDKEFRLPPPVYAPETVAEAILHCAEAFERNVFVGGGGKSLSALGYYAPRLLDKVMETDAFADSQKTPAPPPRENNGLDRPSENLSQRGNYDGHTMESSFYTKAALNPVVTIAAVAGISLGIIALFKSKNKPNDFKRESKGVYPRLRSENIMFDASQIREHMEVFGSDDVRVGTVDKVEGDKIKLTKNDSPDGRHHEISLNVVHSIEQNKIRLSRTAEEARRQWQSV